MRSIFLKIFLSFWLVLALIGLALAVIWTQLPGLVGPSWRALSADGMQLYTQSAAEIADRDGGPALDVYLQQLERKSRVRVGLLDSQGHLVAGREFPQARQAVAQALLSGRVEFDLTATNIYFAQKVRGPSTREYVLVAQSPRSLFGIFRPDLRAQGLRWGVEMAISGFIFYWLARYLTRPIIRLRVTARQLAAGDLTARADPQLARRADETGELVQDFNQMAERIESLVTLQRQLITDISHELRSPLARLNVALELARQRAGEEAAPMLDRMAREADRLNELIGRLLGLARMQSAAALGETSRFDLLGLVDEVGGDAAFEARSRNCEVAVSSAESCPIRGNPELLRSAIENVVRNAVRYTADGTRVEIAVTCAGDTVCVRVRDHGPGVPEKELGNLFRPFYRVANARDRGTGGTGLGLAIADRAVRFHGGTVRAMNASDGGLVVEIRLPILRDGNRTLPQQA